MFLSSFWGALLSEALQNGPDPVAVGVGGGDVAPPGRNERGPLLVRASQQFRELLDGPIGDGAREFRLKQIKAWRGIGEQAATGRPDIEMALEIGRASCRERV